MSYLEFGAPRDVLAFLLKFWRARPTRTRRRRRPPLRVTCPSVRVATGDGAESAEAHAAAAAETDGTRQMPGRDDERWKGERGELQGSKHNCRLCENHAFYQTMQSYRA